MKRSLAVLQEAAEIYSLVSFTVGEKYFLPTETL